MKECKNPTCTAPVDGRKPAPGGSKTYCSRRCQNAMKTVTCGRHLPDVWVSQDAGRAMAAAAEARGMTLREWIATVLEVESGMYSPTLFALGETS